MQGTHEEEVQLICDVLSLCGSVLRRAEVTGTRLQATRPQVPSGAVDLSNAATEQVSDEIEVATYCLVQLALTCICTVRSRYPGTVLLISNEPVFLILLLVNKGMKWTRLKRRRIACCNWR